MRMWWYQIVSLGHNVQAKTIPMWFIYLPDWYAHSSITFIAGTIWLLLYLHVSETSILRTRGGARLSSYGFQSYKNSTLHMSVNFTVSIAFYSKIYKKIMYNYKNFENELSPIHLAWIRPELVQGHTRWYILVTRLKLY